MVWQAATAEINEELTTLMNCEGWSDNHSWFSWQSADVLLRLWCFILNSITCLFEAYFWPSNREVTELQP